MIECKCKRKYDRISDEQRKNLIELISEHGESIKKAAIKLNISYDNAKAINRVFRKETRIEKCKQRKKR